MLKKKSFHQIFIKPILFIGALLLLAGVYCYTHMSTNLFPDVLFPRITIIADAGDQPIERMMVTITKPLESAVKKVAGVTVVKSSTSRGNCVIDVFFKWGTDVYAMKNRIEARTNEIKDYLPDVVLSTEVQNPSLFPVYGYTLESSTHTPIELRNIGNLVVRPLFSRVKGISNVVLYGGKSKEYVIIPDAMKMSALGIPISKIKDAFDQTNFVTSNGIVNTYNRVYLTLTDTRLNNIEDIENVILSDDGTRTIHVKDIAQVKVDEQQEFVKINANGKEVLQIDLVKQPDRDLLAFSKDVELEAKTIRAELPKGYTLKTYYDQSAFVGDSIHSVTEIIYEGLLLALLVMILFLRSWRASLVVLITIPITLTLSFVGIYLAGITMNIMSLGAIAAAVGLIIDDAIVVIEQIYRSHEENPSLTRFEAVKSAISYLFPAMVASSLATIVIFFPFSLMTGMAGSFFKELSTTMQITLIASFLVTWIVLPSLHLLIGYRESLRKKNHEKDTHETILKRVHWLVSLFSKPWIALLLLLIIGVSTWFASSRLNTGFLPELDEGNIILDYNSPPGTDLEETDRLCKIMEKIILSNPDIETYSRRTGVTIGFEINPPNFGDYLIQLKKDRKHSTEEIMSDLRKSFAISTPTVTTEFGQRITDILGDLMNKPEPIEIKLFGTDYAELKKYAREVEKVMDEVTGVQDIKNGLTEAGPSFVFKPKQNLLSQYGISLPDFQNQLSAYTGGISLSQRANIIEPSPAQASMTTGLQVGTIQEGEFMHRILLRFTQLKDNDLDNIKKQAIFLPNGSFRPLSYFCDIEKIPGEIQETRENLKTNIVLTARLENRDLGSVINELKDRFKKELKLPPSCSITFGGAYAEQQQSFSELLTILCLATLLIFAVLMTLFKEWRISFIILFISLMGISGCILALWITGTPLNVSSYTGIIMIVGILAENSIFTVHQFRMNRKLGAGVVESVNYAIALRLRPKLMTALGAILALLPLALKIGMGAQMQQPLAIAVIGGFIVGLPLLLIVLPSLMIITSKKDK